MINQVLNEFPNIGYTNNYKEKCIKDVLGGKMPKMKTDTEEAIVKFVEECYYIVCMKSNGTHSEYIQRTFENYKKGVAKDFILMPEILLVSNIIGSVRYDLTKYVDVSPLAELYVNKKIKLLSYKNYIAFILRHLFDEKIEV